MKMKLSAWKHSYSSPLYFYREYRQQGRYWAIYRLIFIPSQYKVAIQKGFSNEVFSQKVSTQNKNTPTNIFKNWLLENVEELKYANRIDKLKKVI